MSSGWRRGLIGVATFLVFLEIFPRLGIVDERFLPPLSATAVALLKELGRETFWWALLQTLQGWSIGLAIAAVAGLAVGVVIATVPGLRTVTASTIEFLRPVPSVALIPLAVLMFGLKMEATLVLIVYASFWQVLIQVLSGVRDIDPVAQQTARSYRLSLLTQIRVLVWPTALPYVLTGLRLAATVALVLEITGELVIGSPGLGRQLALAQSAGAVDSIYAFVIVVGLLGMAVNVFVRGLERRVLRWHVSVRREVAS